MRYKVHATAVLGCKAEDTYSMIYLEHANEWVTIDGLDDLHQQLTDFRTSGKRRSLINFQAVVA